MAFARVLAALAAVSMLLVASGTAAERPASAPQSGSTAKPSPPPTVGHQPDVPSCEKGVGVLAVLSTRDRLAQLLMVGVRNTDDAKAVVARHHVGGIFIGSWTDLSMLTDGSLAGIAGNATPLPLAVSVDEEGGRVSRLSELIGSAPSARALARTRTADEVYTMALDRGRKMRNLGITIDFAPVVDVSDAPDDTVIGDRSFGSNPAVVTEYAGAYARGLRDAGLLPVLKHFPGHGHGSGDSHTGAVTTPLVDELQRTDLVPYRALLTAAPVGVMMGHLQVPGLTSGQPASLSPAALQLLRGGSGYGGPPFDGPVFSDDLSSMAAINRRYGVAEAVLRALQAGTDTALWVTTDEVPAVLDRLEKAVPAGELAMPVVDASVLRMAAVKGPLPSCDR